MTQAGLSLCMISRDEEKWIQKPIKSTLGLWDECILVDTGSSDATVTKARELGARIYSIDWENDFSKARNYSIALAQYEWILVLDADEILDEKTCLAIKDLIQSSKEDRIILTQTTYCASNQIGAIANQLKIPESNSFPAYTESKIVRLFRNRPYLKFKFCVHECLVDLRSKNQRAYDSQLRIHHYGIVRKDQNKNKSQNYLQLALKKLSDEGENFQNIKEYIIALVEAGHGKEILPWFDKLKQFGDCDVTLLLLLGQYYFLEKKYCDAKMTFKKVLELEDNNTHAMIELSKCYYIESEYKQAQEQLVAAFHLNPNMKVLLWYLAKVYLALMDYEQSKKFFELSKPHFSHLGQFQQDLAQYEQIENDHAEQRSYGGRS